MTNELLNKKCKPCEDKEGVLDRIQIMKYLKEVKGWKLSDSEKKIEKVFEFKNFKEALGFLNQVGEVAEEEGHHPDMELFNWNKVRVSLSTHSIGGLSENDFILAAKVDKLQSA